MSNGDGTFDFEESEVGASESENSFLTAENRNIHVGDWNGDGLTDLLHLHPNPYPQYSWVALSDGDGTFTWKRSLPGASVAEQSYINVDHKNIHVGDWNQDGLTDLYHLHSNPDRQYSWVALSKGDGTFSFQMPGEGSALSNNNVLSGQKLIYPGDWNGDGFLDLLHWYPYQDDHYSWVALNSQKPVPKILSITNGLGYQIVIEYEQLTSSSVYTKYSNSNPLGVRDVTGPIQVVSLHSNDDGLGGGRTTTYQYEGLKVNRLGRGNLGFAKRIVTDQTANIKEITRYSQTFPFAGLPLEKKVMTDGVTTNQVFTDYEVNVETQLGGTTYFPFVQKTHEHFYNLSQPRGRYKQVVIENEYNDSYGNLTQSKTSIYDGVSIWESTPTNTTKVVNEYDNHVGSSRWHLGRLRRTEVTRTAEDTPDLSRVSDFEYDPATGILVTERILPSVHHNASSGGCDDTSEFALCTAYEYDSYGNQIKTTVAGPDVESRVTDVAYTPDGRFVQTVTNALGHSETHVYDDFHGQQKSLIGPNGLETTWQYDGFGRQIRETRPDDSFTTTDRLWCNSGNCPSNGKLKIVSTESAGGYSEKIFDERKQEIQQTSTGFDGARVIRDFEYNALGQLTRQTAPYFAGDEKFWTSISYDALGRITERNAPIDEGAPTGAITSFTYHGLITTQTDEEGQTTTTEVTLTGAPFKVTDALNGTVTFKYDAYDNLQFTTDAAGNVVSMDYDIQGRKIAMQDPDMGQWTYDYNPFGELDYQQDAKGQVTTMEYDPLGRMIRRIDPEAQSEWFYDSEWVGALTAECISNSPTTACLDRDHNGANVAGTPFHRSYSYTTQGLVELESTTAFGKSYALSTTYDSNSRIKRITYPSLYAIEHDYEPTHGYLNSISEVSTGTVLWELGGADARGNTEFEILGHGVTTLRHFDAASGRLDSIDTGTSIGTEVQSLSYSWDKVGNLKSREDRRQNNLKETFEYDALHRLDYSELDVAGLPTFVNFDVNFDAVGNITYKQGVGNYDYGNDGVRPHAVRNITGTRPATYVYDDNGNLTSGDGRTIVWSAFDKPTSIIKGENSASFNYGPNRQRYRQVSVEDDNGTTDTITTAYIRDIYEEKVKGSLTERIHYISSPDQVIAIKTTRSNGSQDLRYLHEDYLGSTDAVTYESGVGIHIERMAFDAFGKRRPVADWGDDPNDSLLSANYSTTRGYTGHEQLDNVGLIHMNARLYEPTIGRFLSADFIVPEPTDGQAYNRYSYVYGNPLKFHDPTGHYGFPLITPDPTPPPVYTYSPPPQPLTTPLPQNIPNNNPGNGPGVTGGNVGNLNNNLPSDGLYVSTVDDNGNLLVGQITDPDILGQLQAGALAGTQSQIGAGQLTNGAGTKSFLDTLQTGLDVLSLIPGVNVIASLTNTAISIGRGNFGDAFGYGLAVIPGGALAVRGARLLRGVANPVPDTLARVVPDNPITRASRTLGKPGAEDVFVTAASDIRGLNSKQIANRLTIPESPSGFRVIEIPTPGSGIASPINRTDPGFIVGGRTAGGAREFVIPNSQILDGATSRLVR